MSRLLAKRRGLFRKTYMQELVSCRSSVHFSTTAPACDEPPTFRTTSLQHDTPPSKIRYTAGTQKAVRRDLPLQNQHLDPLKATPLTSSSKEASTASTMKPADEDIIAMLATPTWSVRSLLPPENPTQTINQKQLHHLLRLSALPLPKNAAEERKMLKALHSQLHFVGDIQGVNTEGVEPLVRIAEETEVARTEATIHLDDLREVLDKEIVVGRNKRRRRVREGGNVGKGEDWDVFKTAGETIEVPGSGRYFVVRSGKKVGKNDGSEINVGSQDKSRDI